MKRYVAGAVAAVALALGGCVAVPAPYSAYPGEAYYYSGPAVGVGIYAPPVYYRDGPRHRHYHHRGHRHRR